MRCSGAVFSDEDKRMILTPREYGENSMGAAVSGGSLCLHRVVYRNGARVVSFVQPDAGRCAG